MLETPNNGVESFRYDESPDPVFSIIVNIDKPRLVIDTFYMIFQEAYKVSHKMEDDIFLKFKGF